MRFSIAFTILIVVFLTEHFRWLLRSRIVTDPEFYKQETPPEQVLVTPFAGVSGLYEDVFRRCKEFFTLKIPGVLLIGKMKIMVHVAVTAPSGYMTPS
jgi:hypothetical protein